MGVRMKRRSLREKLMRDVNELAPHPSTNLHVDYAETYARLIHTL